MGIEGIDPKESPKSRSFGKILNGIKGRLKEVIGNDFGKNVREILEKTRTRLGDAIYNSFGSIDNFCNLLLKIEQFSLYYDIDDGLVGTYRKEGKYGFVIPIRNEYGEIEFNKEDEDNPSYDKIYSEGGYFIVEQDGKKGLFNDKGEEILPPIYDEIRVIDDFIFLKNGDFWIMMDEKTKERIKPRLECEEILQDKILKLLGYRVAIIKLKDNKFGLLSTKDGSIKIDPLYDEYKLDFLRNRITFVDTLTGKSSYYEESYGDNYIK